MTPDTKTRLIGELKLDEGEGPKIYLDNLNLMTAGVGHLLAVGDEVVPEQVTHWLSRISAIVARSTWSTDIPTGPRWCRWTPATPARTY